jgi:vitamin K-dependent gamma-carboxylase
VFPWLMIAGTTLLFAPDWPRRLLSRVQRGGSNTSSEGAPSDGSPVSMRMRLAVLALGVFAVVQVAMPLRHYAYTSNVRWSEDGYRFSWRVMLSEKAGFVKFEVTDPASGDRWAVSPAEYFTPMQVRVMSTQPDMILQAAHVIRDDFAARGLGGVEVRVDAVVAFNGRAPARLVDPEVDLAATPYRPGPKDWVLGLEEDGSG